MRAEFMPAAGGDGLRGTAASRGRRGGGWLVVFCAIIGLVLCPAIGEAQPTAYGSDAGATEAQLVRVLAGQSSYTLEELNAVLAGLGLPGNDDPTQSPIGKPIALTLIAAILLFMPGFFDVVNGVIVPSGSSSPLESAMSCPVFSGTGALVTEDGCVWTRATGLVVDGFGATSTTQIVSAGGQTFFAPDWIVGGAIEFRTGDMARDGGLGLGVSGEAVDASLAVKHIEGPWLFAGSVAVSSGSFSLDAAGPLEGTDIDTFAAGLRLRAAYTVDLGRWYLRPRVDVDGIYTSYSGYRIATDGMAASVDGSSRASLEVSPMVELGARFDFDRNIILRPYVSAGTTFLPDSTTTTTFDVSDGGLQTARFDVLVQAPSVLAELEAGVQLYQEHGFEIEMAYGLSAGDAFTAQSLSLRGAWHF